ncbi:hypothetical protein NQZ68_001899 [Dissostichus eleginoides]|nr:hypothetical protein NQZ68_001899 [Dissostichus eleginoides]
MEEHVCSVRDSVRMRGGQVVLATSILLGCPPRLVQQTGAKGTLSRLNSRLEKSKTEQMKGMI